MKTLHWTTRDLELLSDDGNRYEIIDGELYVAKQPEWSHQLVCSQLGFLLGVWNELTARRRCLCARSCSRVSLRAKPSKATQCLGSSSKGSKSRCANDC